MVLGHTMDGRSVPLELTKDDEYSYLGSMEEVYHDEPEKFNHILHLIRDYFNHRYVLISPGYVWFVLKQIQM